MGASVWFCMGEMMAVRDNKKGKKRCERKRVGRRRSRDRRKLSGSERVSRKKTLKEAERI